MAKRKTHKEFLKEIKLVHPGFEVIGIYTNNKTKILIQDEIGIQYLCRPDHLLSGKIPMIQSAIDKTFSFKTKLQSINKNIYVLSEYTTNYNKILVQDNLGILYQILPMDLLKGVSPSINSAVDKNEAFKKLAENIHGTDSYNYSEVKYTINYKKVNVHCNKCESYFLVQPQHHLNGSGCPRCKFSKGEKRTMDILNEMNIKFIEQKTFDECRLERLLKFDFYLPEYNTCIEYDGIHHFEPVDVFGGGKEFKKVQLRDVAKNKFCQEQSIKLIRISYKDDIEQVLKENF